MEFKLTVQQANDLREYSKLINVGNKMNRGSISWDLIECRISDGFLTAKIITAVALTLFECKVEGEDGICFIAPPPARFSEKKDGYVTIKAEEDKTIYTTVCSSVTIPIKLSQHEYRYNPFEKRADFTMYVNPKLLAEIMSEYAACGNDLVKIEHTADFNHADYISDKYGRKTAFMECHPPKEESWF